MLSATLGAVVFLFGPEMSKGYTWHDNYEEALEEVQRADRPLFIVFDRGSSAAGTIVGRVLFSDDRVEKALNADYVRMFVDTETSDGGSLAAQFAADRLPRLVVIDRSGRWQVYHRSGVHSADQVLAVLAQYRGSRMAAMTERSLPEPKASGVSGAGNLIGGGGRNGYNGSSISPWLCRT